METASRFRAAVEAADHAGMVACVSDDIVLHSPVKFRPFEGREAVSWLFEALLQTFEDFHYTDELEGEGTHALIFRTRVNGKDVQGLDLMRFDDEGLINDFTVMVRPMSAVKALGDAVLERLQAIAPEPAS
jgi:hypothetical protein